MVDYHSTDVRAIIIITSSRALLLDVALWWARYSGW